jgi:hypothetical protein
MDHVAHQGDFQSPPLRISAKRLPPGDGRWLHRMCWCVERCDEHTVGIRSGEASC